MESRDIKNEQKLVQRMALNDNKAGMKGLDKENINKIIMENTVGSRYYKNEQKKDKQLMEKIQKMGDQLQKFTPKQRKDALRKADEILESIECERNLTKTIIHIDMDAFYASVEERDCPDLKNKPMAVGGLSMLCTSNYIARRYGVRAAMPGYIAKKLCPDLVIVPTNFKKYREVSQECQAIFAEYDPNFMAMSLDEAYLDITDHLEKRILASESERTFSFNEKLVDVDLGESKTRLFGFSAEDVSEEIRFRIHQKTLLTASAGIGPNTMLAKIGSDLNKPNGQKYFRPDRDSIMDFIKQLPIRKVSGIGKVSEQLLASLDITKCGDLYERRADLVLLFSSISCSFFFRASLGCSSTHLENESERKSISTERTFHTISNPVDLYKKLNELCESLTKDLQEKCLQGKTVVLKTKTVDFENHTRSRSCANGLHTKDQIYNIAKELLKQDISAANGKLALRLMGIGLSKLESASSAPQASIRSFFATNKEALASSTSNSEKLSLDINDTTESISANSSYQDLTNHSMDLLKPQTSTSDTVLPDVFEKPQIASEQLESNPIQSENLCNNENSKKSHLDSKNSHSAVEDQHDPTPALNETCEEMTCPICRVSFSSAQFSLSHFNSHIDSCLSRQEIKSILASESNNNQPRKTSPNKLHPPKRRKVEGIKFHSIDKFFT